MCRFRRESLARQPAFTKLAIWSHRVRDRKSTRLNSSHLVISYAVFCLKIKINLCILGSSCHARSCLSVLFYLTTLHPPMTTQIHSLSLHDALPISHPSTRQELRHHRRCNAR